MNRKQLFTKFPYIVAWGQMMGSHGYYIENQCNRALQDKAPDDACCYSDKDNKWSCYSEMDKSLQYTLDAYKDGQKGGVIVG